MLRSLRGRMAVAIALVGALVSLAIGVTVYQLTASSTIARARSALATQVTLAAAISARSPAPVPGATVGDPLAPADLRDAVQRGLLGTDRIGSVLWAGTPARGHRGIYVRTSLAPELGSLATLRSDLLLAGALATLASALLGILLAARLSRRLGHAAAIADRVAGGELEARVDAGGDDEITRLGDAIDGMAAALSERLAHERRFSADVAHELRTPLTALVTASSLLRDDRPAQIVRERVGALRELVEDLLEIARLDAGAEAVQATRADLGELADQAVTAAGGEGTVTVHGAASVVTDPRRVQRILVNLLVNAERHGAPPIEVLVEGRQVTVRDHGGGYREQILREGPRPFAGGAVADVAAGSRAGSGLGLVIAHAQAAAVGARLTLVNAPDGGAQATLTFGGSE
ncbi:MAG TPA: HAMP domain-containing sensor histidine kinase [Solirubrobacteraceae bacterium]|nr:HAMP domain-containing sensor histidine kinase [Solirubrobacteraceae bacterium]